MPNWPQGNSCHISQDDDKNIMRVYISRDLYGASNHNQPGQKVFQEEDINLPKVPLDHICTALEKCPPRREKEASEYESGLDGFTLFDFTHWVSHFPILKEKSNHHSDLGFEENWLSVRQIV